MELTVCIFVFVLYAVFLVCVDTTGVKIILKNDWKNDNKFHQKGNVQESRLKV